MSKKKKRKQHIVVDEHGPPCPHCHRPTFDPSNTS